MNVYERIRGLCKVKGISIAQMERDLNLSRSAAAKWQKFEPNAETVRKLSKYFNVSYEYITTGSDSNKEYINDDIYMIARKIAEFPELRLLFENTKNMSQEEIIFLIQLINKLKEFGK